MTNSNDALRAALEHAEPNQYGGFTFDHSPEEIGLMVMENRDAVLAVLTPSPVAGGDLREADVTIGRFVAQYDEGAAGCLMDADDAQALAHEFKRMQGLIYCHGTLRCAKCDFRLIKTTLTPAGAFANEEPDRCPNCDVPMWRVTWKDEAHDAYKTAESQMDRALEAECALAALNQPAAPVEAGLLDRAELAWQRFFYPAADCFTGPIGDKLPSVDLEVADCLRLVLAAIGRNVVTPDHDVPALIAKEPSREGQIKTVAEKLAAFTGAPYEDWRHFTVEAGDIIDRLSALAHPPEPAASTVAQGDEK